MENKLQQKYDTICYCIYNGVKNLSDGAAQIRLKNVDFSNDEHQFVIALIASCSGILGNKELAIDVDAFSRRVLAKKYNKAIVIKKLNNGQNNVIDINELLDGLRDYAEELCGKDFLYSDIYYEFYCEGENK